MKLLLKALIAVLPAGIKKKFIHVLCEWAVKSTKTKLDDKIWATIKNRL